jgi:hypothetical protein
MGNFQFNIDSLQGRRHDIGLDLVNEYGYGRSDYRIRSGLMGV